MSSFFPADLSSEKTAIVFIEFQNEFTTAGGKLHDAVKPTMEVNNMLQNAKKVLSAARTTSGSLTIVHAPITFKDDYRELNGKDLFGILANVKAGGCFKASEWGGAICDDMTPLPEEIVVAGKVGLCGFASTNLDFLLRQNGITTIALAGFLTNCCVESTMRAAYEKGYKVITLTDCCAATSLEAHEAAIKFTFPMFSVPMTSDEFLAKI